MPQPGLFDDDDSTREAPAARAKPVASGRGVVAAEPAADVLELSRELGARFGGRLFLGTSSWYFPGWKGLVWAGDHSESVLSRRGLGAYAQHPLLNAVSLDRSFYRPVDEATYASLAAQVPPAFRFVVKAAALVTDAVIREPGAGRAVLPNPQFLDPAAAVELCVRPAVRGLGDKLGVLVFQLSPLPARWLDAPGEFIEKLEALWRAVVPELPPSVQVALELRDAAALTPALARSLKAHRVRYCAGLHDRMPALVDQLPMLRALWPGDLVCRWNLQRGLKYEAAKNLFEPFDTLQAPDPPTREELARIIVATLAAGWRAFVTINNKAEGSAPLSVLELAKAILVEVRRGEAR